MRVSSEVSRRNARVLQAFCAAAEANQHRTAIESDGIALSCGEVLAKAIAISEQLRSAGIRPGLTVGAHLPRGVALAPAVLGTWLAGGGYVPLDPEGPHGRAEYILRDSKAHVILTGPDGLPGTIGMPATQIVLNPTGSIARVLNGADSVPAQSVSADPGIDDLAYVIYTSGSTGRPKGVLIGHGQVAAMAKSHEKAVYSGIGNHPRHVALNNVTTADSFFSDFVHIAFGRTLHVVSSQARRDPERLARFLVENRIEVLDATPTQVRSVLLAGRGDALASLTVLIVGGEATTPDLWRQIRGLPGVQAFNMYGPTECTVAVTVGSLRRHAEPVIGTALDGCDVWIMDAELRSVPDGQTGELVVTGRQVGLGYLNPAPHDSENFAEVELPTSGQRVRAYRTGDRGFRNQAGQIVFLGRDDDQVSIGGHRVELGEIDVRLRECSGVTQVAVGLVRRGESATLTAWIVLSDGTTVDTVRAALAAHLPRHMIPALNVVREIPMGPTGKADLASLAAGSASAASPGQPGSSLVALIRGIWREVLGLDGVADGDDFFMLGGDSLKATAVTVRVRSVLDPTLPIRVLFENSRFAEFCAVVSERRAQSR